MFIKNVILLFVLCVSSISYAQMIDPSAGCPNCDNGSNDITIQGNHSYRSASAQAYYWEICSNGSPLTTAEISGSNTTRNVTVQRLGTGPYTIKLTRFVDGVCEESCVTYTNGGGSGDDPVSNCPTANNIGFSNEGADGLCTTAHAFITGFSNIVHVDWTWAIGSHSGTTTSSGPTVPIYYPLGNWNNHYMVICAEVTTSTGSGVCPQVCKSFLMDCGTGLGDPIGGGPGSGGNESIIFPNPSKDGMFSIEAAGEKRIKEVIITNGQGTPIKAVVKDLDRTIDLSRERNGLYFVKILFEDGKTEVQQLQLEK